MGFNFIDKGYNDVPALLPGEFSKLPPGGYVCRICLADILNSKAGNPMLVLFVDIADGEFKNFFKDAASRVKSFDISKQWDNSAIYRQLLFDKDGTVSRFLKGLLSTFQQSNPNLQINLRDFDPNVLRGSLIGFVFAEEEYQKRDGSTSSRVFIKFPKSVDDIKTGNFTVPDTKKISAPVSKPASDSPFDGETIDNDDVPF